MVLTDTTNYVTVSITPTIDFGNALHTITIEGVAPDFVSVSDTSYTFSLRTYFPSISVPAVSTPLTKCTYTTTC